MIKCFIVLLLLGMPLFVFSFGNNDTQIWSGTTIEKTSHNYYCYISEQVKWGGDISDLYLHRTDGGIGLDVNAYLSASLHYKIVNIESASKWTTSHIPYLNVNLSEEFANMEISSRNRVEYWSRASNTNFWRYRSRIKIEPIEINNNLPVSFYIAEEAFINFNSEKLKSLRTYMGVDYELLDQLEIGIYYCLNQSQSGGSWKNSHAFCSSIKFVY